MQQMIDRDHARAAYDELAPAYDVFTAHHDYEHWTATLERLARAHGSRGRRLLDVACGTGKSFLPFLARGYEVVACDVSEEMARIAAQKAGDGARVEVHDMRALPQLGSFDLVCCLGDALNYLLTEDELRAALEGVRRNLADDGVVVFDVNTVRSHRTFYGSLMVVPGEDRVVISDGHAPDGFGERDLAACTLEIVERRDDGTWERRRSLHRQRHHPRAVVEAALRAAGLRCVGVYGMQLDGSCAEGFREDGNSKAVYIARQSRGERRKGVSTNGHPDPGAAGRDGGVVHQGQLRRKAGASPHGGGAPRYRLRGTLEAFFASDGDVYLVRGGAGREHVVRQPDADDRALLRALAGDGVEAPAGSRAAERIAPLVAAGAVVPMPCVEALGPLDAQRFDRQLPYLEDFGDPVAAQRRLRAASVAVLGCGGLGAWALGALASAGIGRFLLIDDDVVELSNLNRQILYGAGDVGQPKVELAAAWVARFDPAIEVEARRTRVRGPGDLAGIEGCDALLLLADWPPYDLARWVNEACVQTGVPFLTAGQQPPLVKVGPTYLPGHGACFACHERQMRAEYPLYDEMAEERRREPPRAATLGPASALIGSLLAGEVMHLLLGHRRLATHDRAVVVDLRTLETRSQAIARDPDCPRCSARQ